MGNNCFQFKEQHSAYSICRKGILGSNLKTVKSHFKLRQEPKEENLKIAIILLPCVFFYTNEKAIQGGMLKAKIFLCMLHQSKEGIFCQCFVFIQNLPCPCIHLETLLHDLYSIVSYLLSMF